MIRKRITKIKITQRTQKIESAIVVPEVFLSEGLVDVVQVVHDGGIGVVAGSVGSGSGRQVCGRL